MTSLLSGIGARRGLFFALAAILSGAVLWGFAGPSDAVFSLYDPVFYAVEAEDLGAASISGHHPLFHGLVLGITKVLQACAVGDAGFFACQLVACAGLLAALAAIAAAAQWRWAALLLCALFASCRGVLLHAAGGETVLPALAALLWCLLAAARPGAPERKLMLFAVVALLLRQDSVLIIPALVFLLRRTQQWSWFRIACFVTIAGVITVASYVLLWWISARNPSFFGWLFQFMVMEGHSWGDATTFGFVERLLLHTSAYGVAAVGDLAAPSLGVAASAGLLIPAALVVAARLNRGNNAQAQLSGALIIALTGRFAFSMWFEPTNWEWAVMGLGLAVAAAACWLAGAPTTEPSARVAASLLLALLLATCVHRHGTATLALRDAQLARASAAALAIATPREACDFAAAGQRAQAAWIHRRVPLAPLDLAAHLDFPSAARALAAQTSASRRRTLVLLDRGVGNGFGAPERSGIPTWLELLDTSHMPPGVLAVRQADRVWALALNLPQ